MDDHHTCFGQDIMMDQKCNVATSCKWDDKDPPQLGGLQWAMVIEWSMQPRKTNTSNQHKQF
jgi:hypothetical protein